MAMQVNINCGGSYPSPRVTVLRSLFETVWSITYFRLLMQCSSAEQYVDELYALLKQREDTIKQVALSSKNYDAPIAYKERRMQLVGISLDDFCQLTAPLDFDHYDLPPVNNKPKILKEELKYRLIKYIAQRDY